MPHAIRNSTLKFVSSDCFYFLCSQLNRLHLGVLEFFSKILFLFFLPFSRTRRSPRRKEKAARLSPALLPRRAHSSLSPFSRRQLFSFKQQNEKNTTLLFPGLSLSQSLHSTFFLSFIIIIIIIIIIDCKTKDGGRSIERRRRRRWWWWWWWSGHRCVGEERR